MRVVGMVLGCALLGLVVAPNMNYKANAAGNVDRELLQPGTSYVANFAYAERRDACLRLNYSEGSDTFAACLEGNFPENPWFAS